MKKYRKAKITIHPPLKAKHLAYLLRFKAVRHMKRDVNLLEDLPDPLRIAVGLPLGEEGGYYVAGEITPFEEEGEDPSILNYNLPPKHVPWLWCVWTPNGNGEKLYWSGRPDRYNDEDKWLKFLIEHFFSPWGYELRGKLIDKIF